MSGIFNGNVRASLKVVKVVTSMGFGLRVFEKSYWARDLPSLATVFTDSEDLRPF
jgi:hypothetical protein